MQIRQATADDCAQIVAFWNPYIRETDVTFNSVEKTPDVLAQEIAAKATQSHPFLVADQQGEILGFATYGQFRASNGYRHTMEHTIILKPHINRRGVGRKLMDSIERHARAHGVHSMFAGVSHRNPDGIAFHTSVGYKEVARLPEVGRKFDRWYDLVLMQKLLQT